MLEQEEVWQHEIYLFIWIIIIYSYGELYPAQVLINTCLIYMVTRHIEAHKQLIWDNISL